MCFSGGVAIGVPCCNEGFGEKGTKGDCMGSCRCMMGLFDGAGYGDIGEVVEGMRGWVR